MIQSPEIAPIELPDTMREFLAWLREAEVLIARGIVTQMNIYVDHAEEDRE